MSKLEEILNKIMSMAPNGVLVIDSSKLKEKKFVVIDNRQASCSESDLFYINTMNISELNNFLDVDGLYKINIVFTDGSALQITYYEYTSMYNDFMLLLRYFENNFSEDIDINDGSDSDSDSDSEDDVEQTGTLYYGLVGYGNVSPSYPYTNSHYDLYVWDNEIQYQQDEIPVIDDSKPITYHGTLSGKQFYANIYNKYIQDYENPDHDYYEFDDDITFHDTLEEAQNEQKSGNWLKATVLITVNGLPVRVEDL